MSNRAIVQSVTHLESVHKPVSQQYLSIRTVDCQARAEAANTSPFINLNFV